MEKSNGALTKRDVLEWLEMQRDAINTEIVYAAPDDKRKYFGNLKIVNWLADRVQDMTAVEYLKAKTEMCDSERNAASCKRCDLRGICEERGCAYFEQEHPRLSVAVVKRWKEEQDGND